MIPKTTRLNWWRGPLPEPGEYFRTAAGSTYLILTIRENKRRPRRSRAFCHLGKLEPEELGEMPPDAIIHPFAWAPRHAR